MKTYLITYSTGVEWEYTCKSLLAAKQKASRHFDFASRLNGVYCIIYLDGQVVARHNGGDARQWLKQDALDFCYPNNTTIQGG
jgi:hypothetical protein